MLVGLNGVSRSGKDSVARILVNKFGFEQRALADGIRKILLHLNPWLRDNDGDLVQLRWLYEECLGDWDLVKARSQDSVEFMIRLGQQARDTISEDVWLQAAFPDMTYNESIDGHVVISDIRQPNEVLFVQQWSGELWKVERPGTKKRGMDSLIDQVSFDIEIDNDGSLEDLEDRVSSIMFQDKILK